MAKRAGHALLACPLAAWLHGCSPALHFERGRAAAASTQCCLPSHVACWSALTFVLSFLLPACLQEPGDLDYAAVALLALICSLLECLVGKEGLLNDSIPDFPLLAALQVRREGLGV